MDYYPAIFQGSAAMDSIYSAIEEVSLSNTDYDALIFIRGGGSVSDLNFLNEYKIAERLATFKVPVLSGVGHMKDVNIPDIVSNMSFDTPSKVALFIKSTIIKNANVAIDNFQRINKNTVTNIERSQDQLDSALMTIKQTAKTKSVESGSNVTAIMRNFINIVGNRSNQEHIKIIHTVNTLKEIIKDGVSISKHEIESQIYSVINNNPKKVLDRGFAYITVNDKHVSKAKDITTKETITIHMRDQDVLVKKL